MPKWIKDIWNNDMREWRDMLSVVVDDLKRIIFNPECFSYSLVVILLSSLGLWVVFFPDDWWRFDKITGESVFTFCIAMIGSMAMEFFFDRDSKEERDKGYALAAIVGLFALIFAFLSYSNDDWKLFAFVPTVVLWLFVNSRRKLFYKKENKEEEKTTEALKGSDSPNFKGGL
jgi:peptidoglycan/LPS O-acetylase OafA/YrhL